MWKSGILILFAGMYAYGQTPGNNSSTIQFRYHQNFEQDDFVEFLKSDGEYVINFKGPTEEKAFSGKRSFKFDVTFQSGTYAYWILPVSVPAEGRLTLFGRYAIDPSSTGTAALGVRFRFSPTTHTRDQLLGGNDSPGGWKTTSSDLVRRGQITAMHNIDRQWIWAARSENVGAELTGILISLPGSPGQRVIVYLDDIRVEGTVPDAKTYHDLIQEKWKPVKQKVDQRMSFWKKSLAEIEEQTALLTEEHSYLQKIKQETGRRIGKIKSQLSAIDRCGFVYLYDQQVLDAFLSRFALTLSSLSAENSPPEKLMLYVLPPISGAKVLPFDPLVPGELTRRIHVTATPGEYEPASFVVSALEDINSLTAVSTDLQGENGTIPADRIDIRTVTCWYQAGTAWYGYDQDKSRKVLVPELLLKDDTLIKVDHREKKNYLKVVSSGKEHYLGISNPDEPCGRKAKILSVAEYSVRDSRELLPVAVASGTSRQFWITVHVPETAREGVYKGVITLRNGAQPLGSVAMNVTVLPFKLAAPKTYYDLTRSFVSSIYYRGILSREYPGGSISSEYKSKEQLKAELKNLFIHGVTNPTCYQPFDEELLREYLTIRQELGMGDQPLYYLGVRTDKPVSLQKETMKLARSFGIDEVYFYGIDEAEGDQLKSQRSAWQATHAAGGKVFVAGWPAENIEAMGDIQDIHICAYSPSIQEADKWHSMGHRVWNYANPQSGPENPEIFRKNFGLQLWKSNYDGAATYAYQHSSANIWNDFDHYRYRDHNFVYPTVNGVIDTLAWEGYREGMDDIRYATTLKCAIEKALKSGNSRLRDTAFSARQYLDLLDLEEVIDLNKTRSEIIDYILRLRK